jgi:hypothetical protein
MKSCCLEGGPDFAESLFAFVPEYHVDAMLELCNTLRLYMHPTIPVTLTPGKSYLIMHIVDRGARWPCGQCAPACDRRVSNVGQSLDCGYGPFFLCVIHKEGLCPISGDINRLMMMMILLLTG